MQSLSDDIGSDTVADGIHLGIGILPILIDNSHVLWCLLCLVLKQRYDRLCMIILGIRLVKGVERRYLRGGGDIHLTKVRLSEEPFHHSLITLQELGDQCLGVFIAMVFRLHLVVAAQHERLQV